MLKFFLTTILLLIELHAFSQDFVKTNRGNYYNGEIITISDSIIIIEDKIVNKTFTISLSNVEVYRKNGIRTEMAQLEKAKQLATIYGPYVNGHEISKNLKGTISGVAISLTGITLSLLAHDLVYDESASVERQLRQLKTIRTLRITGACMAIIGGIVEIHSLTLMSQKFKTLQLISGNAGIGLALKF